MTAQVETPNILHDCKVMGKNRPLPRAYNTSNPDKIFYMCPYCNYTYYPEEKK